ncbi:MAG: DUF3256 family protein [Bacteroidales bacterium]|nr:DUF3256 family protein [Bacteroidales bacterium]
MYIFKRLAFVVLFATYSVVVWAEGVGNSVDKFFVAMPDNEIEYLNMSLKSDMVDLYVRNSSKRVRNLLGGESWISYIDSSQIDVVLADGKCYLTIRAFEKKRGETIFAVVKTLYTPIADSSVKFYDNNCEMINSNKLFELPEFKNFFTKTDNKLLQGVMDRISMMFLKVDVSEGGDLFVSLDDMWLDVLDGGVSALLLDKKIKSPLRYTWSGKRFKMVEP